MVQHAAHKHMQVNVMTDETTLDRLLNIREVADILGWSVRTVENDLLCGEFIKPIVRKGRLRRWWYRAVVEWIASRADPTPPQSPNGRPRSKG